MANSKAGPAQERDYVPAAPQLWMYDFLAWSLTRAWQRREALTRQIDPRPVDVIADIGCGTGTQMKRLARACSSIRLIGIDPDPP